MARIETDLIGSIPVPDNAYYGIHTQRAVNNFKITGITVSDYPEFIKGLAYVKWAAAQTNCELGVLDDKLRDAIEDACKEVIAGKYNDQFPCDMIQGGAGTSTNMNINEVVSNIAIEKMGHKKGEYQYCSPYDHVNLSQSTNDAYPTGAKLGILYSNQNLIKHLQQLIASFRKKEVEFKDFLKMGRTQLQDAVPMTVGQEFKAFASALEKEMHNLNQCSKYLLEINMGATAIGTGLNAVPRYAELCTKNLSELTGFDFYKSKDLVEDTSDTSGFVSYSAALRRFAVKLSKICNDLRLLASGPRCGLFEINLPAMQAGSSIMPGKVNPVIPEVVNQTCFKVIGNDLTVTFGAEAAQLQLNVMEPVMINSIFESIKILSNAMDSLRENCIDGITVNADHCLDMVKHSIGIVTALNPYIGYENSTKIAKEALETKRSVYDLVLEHKILSKDKLDEILNPKNMVGPE